MMSPFCIVRMHKNEVMIRVILSPKHDDYNIFIIYNNHTNVNRE